MGRLSGRVPELQADQGLAVGELWIGIRGGCQEIPPGTFLAKRASHQADFADAQAANENVYGKRCWPNHATEGL
jgi:hypothetical protein